MSENSISLPPQTTGPIAPNQIPANPAPGEDPKLPGQEQPQEAPPADPAARPASPQAEFEAKKQEATDVLSQAGISYENLEAEYAEKGQISDESYAALEKAGYSRKLVDTFIAGLEADVVKGQVLQKREVENIKAIVGGADAYTKLVGWAKGNLSVTEQAGYDAIMATNNVDAIKMSVQNLQSRYEAVMGRDPKYVNSQGSHPAPQDVYQSWAEVTQDMSDPRYKKDPAFIRKVEAKLARSNI